LSEIQPAVAVKVAGYAEGVAVADIGG
jgi:hypothetical protein